mmetsp:Transcript_3776/g.8563  ORF Transcript_3776/g.8563 Transcript_3776/m.8563 type:complete len:200 (+) Transcript_3776:647-1246(+)
MVACTCRTPRGRRRRLRAAGCIGLLEQLEQLGAVVWAEHQRRQRDVSALRFAIAHAERPGRARLHHDRRLGACDLRTPYFLDKRTAASRHQHQLALQLARVDKLGARVVWIGNRQLASNAIRQLCKKCPKCRACRAKNLFLRRAHARSLQRSVVGCSSPPALCRLCSVLPHWRTTADAKGDVRLNLDSGKLVESHLIGG